MVKPLVFYGVNELPEQPSDIGAIYYTSKGEQYVSKSDGTLLKITDIVFITSLPEIGMSDKLYILNNGESLSLYTWSNDEFILILSKSDVDWSNIINKPNTFTPSEHIHDDRYYTKDEVNSGLNDITNTLSVESHKVKLLESDDADYLQNKLDNVTLAVEGSELKVRSIDGLLIGVANINSWLSGTQGNIQNQINDINSVLSSLTFGMKYIGKFETFSELTALNNKENGFLAVVLYDENKNNGRSMYVYSESLGMWEFIGVFTFADEFTTLKDTPNDYIGQDGKILKVDEINSKIIFTDIDYSEVKNKPSSTITQIDNAVLNTHEHNNKHLLDTYTQSNDNLVDAVSKKHNHNNLDSLNKLSVNSSGNLTINGSEYPVKKKHLYATLSSNFTSTSTNQAVPFKSKQSGDIALNTSTGNFTLEAGKRYLIMANFLIETTRGYATVLTLRTSGNTNVGNSETYLSGRRYEGDIVSTGAINTIVIPTVTQSYYINCSLSDVTFLSRGTTLTIVEI